MTRMRGLVEMCREKISWSHEMWGIDNSFLVFSELVTVIRYFTEFSLFITLSIFALYNRVCFKILVRNFAMNLDEILLVWIVCADNFRVWFRIISTTKGEAESRWLHNKTDIFTSSIFFSFSLFLTSASVSCAFSRAPCFERLSRHKFKQNNQVNPSLKKLEKWLLLQKVKCPFTMLYVYKCRAGEMKNNSPATRPRTRF